MAVLLCMCSGFPAEILEQIIMTSLYDITKFSRATEGGNYKRRVQLSLRGLAAAAITIISVF